MIPREKDSLSTNNIIHILLALCAHTHDPKFCVSAVAIEAELQPTNTNEVIAELINLYVDGQQENLEAETSYAEESSDVDEEEDSNEGDDAYEDEEFLNFSVYGRPQLSVSGDSEYVEQQDQMLKDTFAYMKQVFEDPEFEFIRYRCRNFDHRCNMWATNGECFDGDDYVYEMIENCSPACGTCDVLEDEDYFDEETRSHEFKLVKDSFEPPSMELGLLRPTMWGIPQNLGTTEELQQKVLSLLQSTREYFWDEVVATDSDLAVHCENKHKDCSLWATMGLCETNPGYMPLFCGPACHSCNMLYVNERCPIDPEAPSVFSKPGDMNGMFERIISDPEWELNHGPVSVLSSPAMGGAPWVVTLDNFLTDEECERFIEFGHQKGYKPSMEQGDIDFDGTSKSILSETRTSTETECDHECIKDAILGPVYERVEKLTGSPRGTWESLQLLRYAVNQEYKLHSDFIPEEAGFPAGPIVLTVYFFLSDVEAGGGIHVRSVGPHGAALTIKPKKGKAVIWPSALDENPLEMDERTYHAGNPVWSGTKYGAVVWVHNREYQEQYNKRCVYWDGGDISIPESDIPISESDA